jgi:hypothetical protein
LVPRGRVYLLVSSDTDIELFQWFIARTNFTARPVARRSILIESLIIYELRAIAPLDPALATVMNPGAAAQGGRGETTSS